jgi:hypothetical protein
VQHEGRHEDRADDQRRPRRHGGQGPVLAVLGQAVDDERHAGGQRGEAATVERAGVLGRVDGRQQAQGERDADDAD